MAKRNRRDELGDFDFPPAADPAFSQEARAVARGLMDTLFDLHRDRKRGKKDVRTTTRDIKTDKRRGLGDLGRELARSMLEITQARQDTKLGQKRGEQDFGLRLAALTRSYTQQGQAQNQAINAGGGSAGSGVARAAAAKRAENLALDRQPLDLSRERLAEDTSTSLERLGTQAGQIRTDTRIGRKRLKKDVRHDLRLTRRDWRRDRQDMGTEGQRARREAALTQADLLAQAVWQARKMLPGAY